MVSQAAFLYFRIIWVCLMEPVFHFPSWDFFSFLELPLSTYFTNEDYSGQFFNVYYSYHFFSFLPPQQSLKKKKKFPQLTIHTQNIPPSCPLNQRLLFQLVERNPFLKRDSCYSIIFMPQRLLVYS